MGNNSNIRSTIISLVTIAISLVVLYTHYTNERVEQLHIEVQEYRGFVPTSVLSEPESRCLNYLATPEDTAIEAIFWSPIARQCFYVYQFTPYRFIDGDEEQSMHMPTRVRVVEDNHPGYNPGGLSRTANGYELQWHTPMLAEFVAID